jgi:hypothetical protein
MRRKHCLCSLLIMSVLACVAHATAEPGLPSPQEVAAGLAASDAAIGTLTLTGTTHLEQSELAPGVTDLAYAWEYTREGDNEAYLKKLANKPTIAYDSAAAARSARQLWHGLEVKWPPEGVYTVSFNHLYTWWCRASLQSVHTRQGGYTVSADSTEYLGEYEFVSHDPVSFQTHHFFTNRPLWTSGKGYSQAIGEISKVEAVEEGLLRVTAASVRRNLDYQWTLLVRPSEDWLVVAATLRSPSREEPIVVVTVHDSEQAGHTWLGKAATFSQWSPGRSGAAQRYIGRWQVETVTFSGAPAVLDAVRAVFNAPQY